MTYAGETYIGGGGAAEVYRTADGVAVKRPRPFPGCKERLQREINALGTLSHPNVMPVLDSGTDQYGDPWYSMPLAEGNLEELLSIRVLVEGRDQLARRILNDVAAGLGAMHASGLIHRDVKPANILSLQGHDGGGESRWVVADGGTILQLLEEENTDLTGSVSLIGTRGYLAPESIGQPHDVTVAADVYGLGRVLARVLTGEKPREGLQLLPKGPWRGVIREFTDSNPLKRPQGMAEAIERAESLLAELAVSAKLSFMNDLIQVTGAPDPASPLWTSVIEESGDCAFMLDKAVSIRGPALTNYARQVPDQAKTIALAMCQCLNDSWGNRDFDAANDNLDWILSLLKGLAFNPALMEDTASVYLPVMHGWDRYRHNRKLRDWLTRLRGEEEVAMARAIRAAGLKDYIRDAVMDGQECRGHILASLLA